MRVFLTGATGFIGSAIARELQSAGHEVLGLARTDKAAAALRAAGVEPHLGDLADHQALASGARAADGVIHTAYIHDFTNLAGASEIDTAAVAALIRALRGTGKPLVNTSGITVLPRGRLATEADAPDPRSIANHRLPSEKACLESVSQGVRACVVRPAPSVHGDGDHGFVPYLYSIARKQGCAAYIGDGENRWPAVHVLDAAVLYRLALEKGVAGAAYHAVAEQGMPYRKIAGAIAHHLGVEPVSVTPEQAAAHFDGFDLFVAMDAPTSSERTQEELGWTPQHRDLITDISQESYFQ